MIASTFAQSRQRQRGVALIMALVFLMILTIIGVTALSTTSLQEKMAGNVQDKNTAFQAAESALREAEGIVLAWNSGTTPAFTGNGYYQPKLATDPYPWWAIDATWTTSTAHIAASAVAEAVDPPSYIIEDLGSVGGGSAGTGSLVAGFAPPAATAGGSNMYRITARAVGRTRSAVAMVQSVFRK
jgi:type IV pilus assembly protein PilX